MKCKPLNRMRDTEYLMFPSSQDEQAPCDLLQIHVDKKRMDHFQDVESNPPPLLFIYFLFPVLTMSESMCRVCKRSCAQAASPSACSSQRLFGNEETTTCCILGLHPLISICSFEVVFCEFLISCEIFLLEL